MIRGTLAVMTSRNFAKALILSSLLGGAAFTQPAAAQTGGTTPPILETETSDVSSLPPATPHRVYISGGYGGGFSIIDGDTAKVVGTVNSAGSAAFAVAPDNKFFYVSESMWTRGNRGTRQDLLSIYDGTDLKLVKEIELPGRLIASGRIPFFSISASGTRGYVYNMEPAASVFTVDLKTHKVLSTTETPGCGLVYPFGDAGFASLCADGTLASVALDAKAKGTITITPQFFDPEKDPVFEESIVDIKSSKAFFITYTGMVFPAQLGATSKVAEGWSLQRAAGLGVATPDVQQKTWRPGGRRPFAYHAASGTLYALMHNGKHWTQKEHGSELWVIDTATQKVTKRIELLTDGRVVGVSQDANPQLYVVSGDGLFQVLDPATGKMVRHLTEVGGRTQLIAVTGF